MPNHLVTASVDHSTKGKRLAAWHFSNSGAAAVINLREGSATGDIIVPIQLAATTSASQAYNVPDGCPTFSLGCYVQVVSGTIVGSVTLV
jgi:hypothetical protein